jgi:integrase
MGNIRARTENGKLFFDFSFRGKRCREQTALDDTPANRKKLEQMMNRIEAEITLGSFDYGRYFPDSPNVAHFAQQSSRTQPTGDTPRFREFAETWVSEMSAQWRKTHLETINGVLTKYLLPEFGDKEIGKITKADIMAFRSTLSMLTMGSGKPLSASRRNHIMTPLNMILNEAANRYEFTSPYHGIKPFKVPMSDVEPFTLDEVKLILDHVRADFRNYYTVRFFTGMRTGEIDGLHWKFVDFERRQVLVRQALVKGEMVYTKNDGSFRAIDMSQLVFDALQEQKKATGDKEFVFCNTEGGPLTHNNVTKRVWYPLLRYLNLRARRPYQTRHTAATFWLAAGESPEWIARQMGHTTTEMLFRVYSRYVPNLTRQDGSAFERLVTSHFIGHSTDNTKENNHDQATRT